MYRVERNICHDLLNIQHENVNNNLRAYWGIWNTKLWSFVPYAICTNFCFGAPLTARVSCKVLYCRIRGSVRLALDVARVSRGIPRPTSWTVFFGAEIHLSKTFPVRGVLPRGVGSYSVGGAIAPPTWSDKRGKSGEKCTFLGISRYSERNFPSQHPQLVLRNYAPGITLFTYSVAGGWSPSS